jgi:hypothetical protein
MRAVQILFGVALGVLAGAIAVGPSPAGDGVQDLPLTPAGEPEEVGRETERATASRARTPIPRLAPAATAPHAEATPVRTVFDTAAASADHVLRVYDRRAWTALPAQIDAALLASTEVRRCGASFARRAQVASWLFVDVCAIEGQVAGNRFHVRALHCSQGEAGTSGDAAFVACLAQALASAAISCPGCREGEIVFPWSYQISFGA